MKHLSWEGEPGSYMAAAVHGRCRLTDNTSSQRQAGACLQRQLLSKGGGIMIQFQNQNILAKTQ